MPTNSYQWFWFCFFVFGTMGGWIFIGILIHRLRRINEEPEPQQDDSHRLRLAFMKVAAENLTLRGALKPFASGCAEACKDACANGEPLMDECPCFAARNAIQV